MEVDGMRADTVHAFRFKGMKVMKVMISGYGFTLKEAKWLISMKMTPS